MIDKQIKEISNVINYTLLGYNRFRAIGDVTTALRQYQLLTFVRSALSAADLATNTATAQAKVFTLL